MALRSLTPVPITSLPAATTPLSGTEAVAVVQSGTTSQVAVSDLTAGRSVSASALTASTGNLTFSSTAQRITGDFSNATVANRLAFQTSTVNGATSVTLIPNGTSANSSINLFNAADPTNAALAGIVVGVSDAQFRSGITGTGTYLPMTFYTGGSERVRIDTSGLLGIGLTPTASVGNLQVSGGAFATSTMYVGAPGSTAFSGGIQNLSNTSRSIALEADPTNAGANTVMYFNLDGSTRMTIDSSGNVGIGTTSFGASSQVVLAIANATAVPTGNPTGGGVLYVEAGALKYRGSSGTVTTIANA